MSNPDDPNPNEALHGKRPIPKEAFDPMSETKRCPTCDSGKPEIRLCSNCHKSHILHFASWCYENESSTLQYNQCSNERFHSQQPIDEPQVAQATAGEAEPMEPCVELDLEMENASLRSQLAAKDAELQDFYAKGYQDGRNSAKEELAGLQAQMTELDPCSSMAEHDAKIRAQAIEECYELSVTEPVGTASQKIMELLVSLRAKETEG